MKAYSEYIDSNISGVDKIPSKWTPMRFRHLFSIGRGLGITKENLQDNGIPCVNYGEIHSKYGFELNIAKHPLKCVSEEYISSSPNSLLNKGDLVFADTSEDLEGAGNFTQLVTNDTTFAGYHTVIARQIRGNDDRFLAYALESDYCRNQIRRMVKGVKVFSITQAILKDTSILLPSYKEQKSISSYLDANTTRIDNLISEKQNFIKLLQEKRQALISHVVTKGLDDNVKMKPSGVDWIGDIPTLWETSSLRWRIKIRSGDSLANDQFEKVSDDLNAIPVVGGNGLMAYTKQPNSYGNRIIIGRVGSHCGNVHKVNYPSWITDNALIVDTWNGFDQDFLIHLLRTLKINDLANKTALPLITGNQVKSIIVPIPPQEEQQEIVQFLHDKMSVIDQLIIETEGSIKLLQEHRTALISAAVTGKIDVREVA